MWLLPLAESKSYPGANAMAIASALSCAIQLWALLDLLATLALRAYGRCLTCLATLA